MCIRDSSDAKEWALRLKDKGFSYNTINNHKRSLKASFYIAIHADCVRKNPFAFKLSEVLENDTTEKVALTEEQEQALLSFIKTDNVYHKYYDDVLILLKVETYHPPWCYERSRHWRAESCSLLG